MSLVVDMLTELREGSAEGDAAQSSQGSEGCEGCHGGQASLEKGWSGVVRACQGGGCAGSPCCAFSPQAERIAQSEQLAPITVSFPCRTPYAQSWHIWHWVWLLGQSGARCLQWRLTTAAHPSRTA